MNTPASEVDLITSAKDGIAAIMPTIDQFVREMIESPTPSVRYAAYGLASARIHMEDALTKLSNTEDL